MKYKRTYSTVPDFEKLCSVSLSRNNVYACLICGKYFQVKNLVGRFKWNANTTISEAISTELKLWSSCWRMGLHSIYQGYESGLLFSFKSLVVNSNVFEIIACFQHKSQFVIISSRTLSQKCRAGVATPTPTPTASTSATASTSTWRRKSSTVCRTATRSSTPPCQTSSTFWTPPSRRRWSDKLRAATRKSELSAEQCTALELWDWTTSR